MCQHSCPQIEDCDPQHEESAPVYCKRTTISSQLTVFVVSTLALLLPNISSCSSQPDPEKTILSLTLWYKMPNTSSVGHGDSSDFGDTDSAAGMLAPSQSTSSLLTCALTEQEKLCSAMLEMIAQWYYLSNLNHLIIFFSGISWSLLLSFYHSEKHWDWCVLIPKLRSSLSAFGEHTE